MISYSQCWEDAELMLEALQVSNNDSVLSVTSDGCNTLALAEANPKYVFSIDSNRTQNYILELKLIAIKALKNKEIPGFLGYENSKHRIKTYKEICGLLSKESKDYWDSNLKIIKNGIVHCGKFERYLAFFRKFILPLIHSEYRKFELLNPVNPEAQLNFYENKWNNRRWRLVFRIFFSKIVMSGRGRRKEMFSQGLTAPVSSTFFNRIEQALKHSQLSNNFYFSYILFGKRSNLFPYFLLEENLNKVREFENIKIQNAGIYSFLKTLKQCSVSKFNFSDIFEPLNEIQTNEIFNEIYRTGVNGARLIFYNNLVQRDVPGSLKGSFIRDFALEEKLKRKNKVFFYDKFLIYTILK